MAFGNGNLSSYGISNLEYWHYIILGLIALFIVLVLLWICLNKWVGCKSCKRRNTRKLSNSTGSNSPREESHFHDQLTDIELGIKRENITTNIEMNEEYYSRIVLEWTKLNKNILQKSMSYPILKTIISKTLPNNQRKQTSIVKCYSEGEIYNANVHRLLNNMGISTIEGQAQMKTSNIMIDGADTSETNKLQIEPENTIKSLSHIKSHGDGSEVAGPPTTIQQGDEKEIKSLSDIQSHGDGTDVDGSPTSLQQDASETNKLQVESENTIKSVFDVKFYVDGTDVAGSPTSLQQDDSETNKLQIEGDNAIKSVHDMKFYVDGTDVAGSPTRLQQCDEKEELTPIQGTEESTVLQITDDN